MKVIRKLYQSFCSNYFRFVRFPFLYLVLEMFGLELRSLLLFISIEMVENERKRIISNFKLFFSMCTTHNTVKNRGN